MAKTALVIFDCDGVLVDSEVISNRVLAEVVSELGWPMDVHAALSHFKGRAMPEVWARVAQEVGSFDSEPQERDFRRRQLAAFRQELAPIPGVRALIDTLAVPYCVASNGTPEKMQTTLGAVGLLPYFQDRMFSRLEVPRSKPHPDLFLHAAARMGCKPADCLVVEDSPLGIEAARRAGMRRVGFAGTATADAQALRAAGAERVLMDIGELRALL